MRLILDELDAEVQEAQLALDNQFDQKPIKSITQAMSNPVTNNNKYTTNTSNMINADPHDDNIKPQPLGLKKL